MMLFTKEIREKLLENGANRYKAGHDPVPVVKLFYPAGAATWLPTELDPDDPDVAFGLADLGFGTPELGSIYMPELESFTGRFGLKIERDRWFKGTKPLSEYADEARTKGRIVA